MAYYLGEIRMWTGSRIPTGWRLCDGSLLNVTENEELFSLIGTIYGGDGVNTFALPDLRGRVAIGQGQGRGLTKRVLGATGGREDVALTAEHIPSHTHAISATSAVGTASSPANYVWANGGTLKPYSSATPPDVAMSKAALATSGGNQPHNNVMPSLAINFIIAVQGGKYPTEFSW